MNPDGMMVFDIETISDDNFPLIRILENRSGSIKWPSMVYQQVYRYDGKDLGMISHPSNLQDHFRDEKELFTI